MTRTLAALPWYRSRRVGRRVLDVVGLSLLLTGLALVTVVKFLAHDLERWARAHGEPGYVVTTVRVLLTPVGVLAALVALISRTGSVPWHDFVATLLVVVFALTLVTLPVLLRGLPGGLLAFTAAAFGMLVALVILHLGVGYLNLTAFEMGGGGGVRVAAAHPYRLRRGRGPARAARRARRPRGTVHPRGTMTP